MFLMCAWLPPVNRKPNFLNTSLRQKDSFTSGSNSSLLYLVSMLLYSKDALHFSITITSSDGGSRTHRHHPLKVAALPVCLRRHSSLGGTRTHTLAARRFKCRVSAIPPRGHSSIKPSLSRIIDEPDQKNHYDKSYDASHHFLISKSNLPHPPHIGQV